MTLRGVVLPLPALQAGSEPLITDITLTDLQIVKGDHHGDTYVLRVLGGTVGEETIIVGGAPRFTRGGRKYLLFIKGNGMAMFPMVGADQGMFHHVRRRVRDGR